ncbi:MAG: PDZ domain-containing protein [Clostridia bacterium]|nr:PDZ domain-containing protein [Clostridia bacterium]
MKKKGVRIGTVFFLIVATMMTTAIGTYYYVSQVINDIGRNQQMYQKLDLINSVISRNYVLSINLVDGYDDIIDGIASGYIAGLGDEYSYYLDEKNFKSAPAITVGSYVDIGILYSYDPTTGGIKVNLAKAGSPAELAGIEKGDIILSINGTNVTEDGYRRAVAKLSGEPGSMVNLSVLKAKTSELVAVEITRIEYVPQTVSHRIIENGIGYININEFDKTTLTSFNSAVNQLTEKGAKGIVIDVRNNSIGDFSSVVEVLDRIMPSGIIVSVREQGSDVPTRYFSDDTNLMIPLTVIQNGTTAGVAEVFSAALRDTEKAVVVGSVSKGVGVGQRDIPLSDGTAIRLSAYEYVTPAGERFNGVGITPNILVQLDEDKEALLPNLPEEDDVQLQMAVDQLKSMLGIQD